LQTEGICRPGNHEQSQQSQPHHPCQHRLPPRGVETLYYRPRLASIRQQSGKKIVEEQELRNVYKYGRLEAKESSRMEPSYLRNRETITPPRAKMLESDILPGLHKQDQRMAKNVRKANPGILVPGLLSQQVLASQQLRRTEAKTSLQGATKEVHCRSEKYRKHLFHVVLSSQGMQLCNVC
jgi:hypothetical protein